MCRGADPRVRGAGWDATHRRLGASLSVRRPPRTRRRGAVQRGAQVPTVRAAPSADARGARLIAVARSAGGSAIGPGSWPPANLTRAATRLLDGRMGVEQFAESFARIVDAHFHHRGGRARQFAAALDLAQRRDHGVRILRELHRAGVGQVFARARQRQPNDERQHIGDDERATAIRMATPAPPPPSRRRRTRAAAKPEPL